MKISIFIKLILGICLFLLAINSFSQSRKLSTDNKKALANFEKSIEAYNKYDYEETILHLKSAIDQDKNFIEAHLLLSQIYQITGQVELSIVSGENAIRINPDFFPNIYFNLGDLLLKRGEYSRALNYFNSFVSYRNTRAETRERAELYIQNCKFAIKALANPVPFTPINLGPNVNSNMDDYWPSLSADENTLVITVNVPKDPTSQDVLYNRQEDFFISKRNPEGEWEPVRNIGSPINTPINNEGAQSLTADGQKMYFTVCRGNCDIYVSNKENGKWSRPQKLPAPVNLDQFSEKQPSISPDGKTLYFVSNNKKGLGGYDIWRSHRIDDYNWSEPENLGDVINSSANEQSPFIHFDNQTLYFSSAGHVGMGGFDIYMSQMINDSTWSTPLNFGYPINTFRDEDGLIVNASATLAYFSSDINPESGRDIYKFDLPQEVRPIPSSYISGTITDIRNGWPLRADFNLVDIDTDQTIMSNKASENGEFFLCIPTNRNYAFFAFEEGYLYHSEHFSLAGIHTANKPYRKDIELRPIKIGETMVMRNVFFETDSYDLKPESVTELSKLIELLSLSQTMKIEVGGHTDNIGSADYNLTLSENRAKSVAQYLIDNGVDSKRISWKGYGLTKPIGNNETEEGRANNRRTEIKVVEM
jgi:outer membrane protein OmpA-like peptidoglycan-associated protein/tetratricopeptide (TPR) repeat protein